MSFAELGLSDAIVRAVTEHGYTTPTPIQAQAIPAVLKGGDLLAGAQTGTGKTAGFTLPLLQLLSNRPAKAPELRAVRALILTPTRELAAQVEESVRTYNKYVKLSSAVVFGGVNINPQMSRLKQGVDILVATPGRLLDLMQQGAVNLKHVEILILDEADRMLDMGFIRDIKRVLAVLPAKRQNLLFSATFSDEIKTLADGLLNNPAMIEVARRNSTVEVIGQKIHPVDRDRKAELLSHLIKERNWYQVLVFTRTKHGANNLVEKLGKADISALASALMSALPSFSTKLLAPCLVRVKTSTWYQLRSLIRWDSSSALRSRSTGWIFWPMTSTVELRRATSIMAGLFNRPSASVLISSEKVAENSRFWRFAGNTASTRLISRMKPMSSMRSASSRIKISTCLRLTAPCCIRSSRRPGVATRMSTPCFRRDICGLMLTPPKTTADDSFTYLL